jgi:hypothetical protein
MCIQFVSDVLDANSQYESSALLKLAAQTPGVRIRGQWSLILLLLLSATNIFPTI